MLSVKMSSNKHLFSCHACSFECFFAWYLREEVKTTAVHAQKMELKKYISETYIIRLLFKRWLIGAL